MAVTLLSGPKPAKSTVNRTHLWNFSAIILFMAHVNCCKSAHRTRQSLFAANMLNTTAAAAGSSLKCRLCVHICIPRKSGCCCRCSRSVVAIERKCVNDTLRMALRSELLMFGGRGCVRQSLHTARGRTHSFIIIVSKRKILDVHNKMQPSGI